MGTLLPLHPPGPKVAPWAGEWRAVGRTCLSRRQIMSSSTSISTLYGEFTDALTEVLAENAVGPARRGRLARARAAVKKHPDYNEHAYFLAVRPHSHSGKPCKTPVANWNNTTANKVKNLHALTRTDRRGALHVCLHIIVCQADPRCDRTRDHSGGRYNIWRAW